jgi:large subunit ribosomal protein L25
MASHDLTVAPREEKGKSAARRLRYAGQLPAVVYGRKEEPMKLTVNEKEFRDFVAHHGSHGLLSLNIEGGQKIPAVVKELQRHPFKNHVQTIDFLRVSLSEKIHATVPIILEGEPDSVRVEGGVLVQSMHEVEIIALPQNLPEAVYADISHLEFNGAALMLSEIKLPEGIEFASEEDDDVAVVNPPRVEEVAEPTEEEVAAAAAVPAEHGAGDQATGETAAESKA